MKNRIFSSLCVILFMECFLYANYGVSQINKPTWKKQLDSTIDSLCIMSNGDSNCLNLSKYSYKGVIDTKEDKDKIIDSLLANDAPFVMNFPPITESDTIIMDDSSYEVHKINLPVFEIITVGEAMELVEFMDDNMFERIERQLVQLIQIGFEYIELKWSYKGDTFNSLCIVSGKDGIVYEPIGWGIVAGEGKEIHK